VILPHTCQSLGDFRGRLEGEDGKAEEFNYIAVLRSKKWPTVGDTNLI